MKFILDFTSTSYLTGGRVILGDVRSALVPTSPLSSLLNFRSTTQVDQLSMPRPGTTATRSRGWCFTLNNYTIPEIELIDCAPVQYVIYGKEVGENGTPHLQGYVHYKCQVTAGHVKATIGTRCHIEVRRGSLQQAIDYCKKDGVVTEHGHLRIGNENKWTDVIELAKKGDLDTIESEYPAIFFMHKPKIIDLMAPAIEPFQDDPKNHFEWWYGPTGTGKSRAVWDNYPVHYDKQINKWWDGYQYHEVVCIEEADPKKCEHMAYFFKRWADHYPFRAEVKNGHLNNIRPNKIIVTSNYTIKECFPNQQDWEPLLRRFKVIHFDSIHTDVPFPMIQSPILSPIEPAIDPQYNIPEVVTAEEVNPLFLQYDNNDLESFLRQLDL